MGPTKQIQKTRAISSYCILGLSTEATREEIEARYTSLSDNFEETQFIHSPQAWVQASQALMEIEFAYERICNGDEEINDDEQEPFWPKLGQVLVASGKITFEQLCQAIKLQHDSTHHLGEILIDQGLLTDRELEAFLQMQRTVKLNDNSPYTFGQRLIGLRVIPEDMVCIALMEHCMTGTSFSDILVAKGWLSAEVVKALLLS